MGLFSTDLIPDNAVIILHGLLRGLRARVTASTVSKTLLSHPDYPTILALSDALTEWHIDNAVIKFDTTEQLRELTTPFIAHLKRDQYILITNKTDKYITYEDSELGSITKPLLEFEKHWSGVVLFAETSIQSGESNYIEKRKQERLEQLRGPVVLFCALLVSFLTILGVAQQLTNSDWFFLVTKSVGLFASVLIVGKTLGRKNALADQLCNSHSKVNCDNVLHSPGAKLWGWLSWADIGLIYFIGGIVIIMLISSVPLVRTLLAWIALLTLPYVVFSVYYQGFILKHWCPLCLFVQAVLLAEAVLAFIEIQALPITWQPYAVVTIAFLLPFVLWLVLKPLIRSQNNGKLYYIEFMKLWRSPELFQTLLIQQPKMPLITADMRSILLGKPEATHTVTMVTNPYCKPCAYRHQELSDLIKRNNDINAQIIFSFDGINGVKTKMALHTMALDQNGTAQIALVDWYRRLDLNYEAWSADYPVTKPLPNWETTLEHNLEWSALANIDVTPTLFINGYKLPKQYQANLTRLSWLINSDLAT